MKKSLSLILLLSLVWSCKKEDPTINSYADDYRFYVKGTLGNVPFEYNAGEDGYFMKTSYSFSDSVVMMKGLLAPEDGSLRNAFEIIIRSKNQLASLSDFKIEENMEEGPLAFKDATGFTVDEDKYILNLQCDTSSQYQNVKWYFPDGPPVYALSVEREVSAKDYNVYPVRMSTTGNFNCVAKMEHFINIADDCDATFEAKVQANFRVKLSPIARQGTIDNIKWYLNGNPVLPDPSDEILLDSTTGLIHEIKAEISFVSGCTKTVIRTVGANFADQCRSDFAYTKEKVRTYDPQQLATVELVYYDNSGTAYSTYYHDVQGEFRIISSKAFEDNEDGMPTQRFVFETDAVLKNSNGSSVKILDAFGSFAVAHP